MNVPADLPTVGGPRSQNNCYQGDPTPLIRVNVRGSDRIYLNQLDRDYWDRIEKSRDTAIELRKRGGVADEEIYRVDDLGFGPVVVGI
jgi:hypothetical protein